MLQRWGIALVISAFCLAHAAAAENPDPLEKYLPEDRALLGSADYLDFLKAQFIKYEPAVRMGDCHSFTPTTRISVMLADYLARRIEPDGKTPLIRKDEFAKSTYSSANTGSWTEVWDASMCGKTVRRGLIVFRSVQGPLVAMPMVGGNTLADMRLQVDTLKMGLPAFLLPRCEQSNFAVLDTILVDASKLRMHIWTEKWTLTRCGQTASRIINYGPALDGGTTISVDTRTPEELERAAKPPQ